MWNVEINKAVQNKVKKIPEPEKGRIKQAIIKLKDMPELLDIKKLVGRDGYRLRVGKWRLIIDIYEEKKLINVRSLDSRGQVYKDLD